MTLAKSTVMAGYSEVSAAARLSMPARVAKRYSKLASESRMPASSAIESAAGSVRISRPGTGPAGDADRVPFVADGSGAVSVSDADPGSDADSVSGVASGWFVASGASVASDDRPGRAGRGRGRTRRAIVPPTRPTTMTTANPEAREATSAHSPPSRPASRSMMKKTPKHAPASAAMMGPRADRAGLARSPSEDGSSMLTRQMAAKQIPTPSNTDGPGRSPRSKPAATGNSADTSAATGATT